MKKVTTNTLEELKIGCGPKEGPPIRCQELENMNTLLSIDS